MLYDLPLTAVLPGIVLALAGAMVLGNVIGRRGPRGAASSLDTTLAGAGLGLLALMLGFTFSMALSRYEARRTAVLEEADAIGTAWLRAGLLPAPQGAQSRKLLEEYARLRLALHSPRVAAEGESAADIARSVALQDQLWALAEGAARADPSGTGVRLYIPALNDMIDDHERRLSTLRTHVPDAVMWLLIGVTGAVLGYTGYIEGREGSRLGLANLAMAVMVACVIVLIMDLDRPERGLVQVSSQPLLDLVQGLPAPR